MTMLCRLLLLSCLAATAAVGRADSLDDLLACYTEAVGGPAAFEAIHNLRVELDIREPTFEVSGTYLASRDGRMRIDIEAGGRRVFAEGLVDGRAWQWNPEGGVLESNAAGAAALRNGIESPGRFWTLGQLQERGLAVELLEPGPLARPAEWQLRLLRDDGSVIDYFLDRATCLPTREVSRRAFHPDVDASEVSIETSFSEPEPIDGVVRFRRSDSRNLDTGEWLGTTLVRSVEHNVGLPDSLFEAR
jgi:hypothetical protein